MVQPTMNKAAGWQIVLLSVPTYFIIKFVNIQFDVNATKIEEKNMKLLNRNN